MSCFCEGELLYHNLFLGSSFIWSQSDYRIPDDVKRIVESKRYMYEASIDNYLLYSLTCILHILDNLS